MVTLDYYAESRISLYSFLSYLIVIKNRVIACRKIWKYNDSIKISQIILNFVKSCELDMYLRIKYRDLFIESLRLSTESLYQSPAITFLVMEKTPQHYYLISCT